MRQHSIIKMVDIDRKRQRHVVERNRHPDPTHCDKQEDVWLPLRRIQKGRKRMPQHALQSLLLLPQISYKPDLIIAPPAVAVTTTLVLPVVGQHHVLL
jgi:hypothetical protein